MSDQKRGASSINDPIDSKRWTETLVTPDSPIREMLIALGQHRLRIALVVDEHQRLLGTITDGDIRRSMLAGVSADSPVSDIMFTQFTTTCPESTDKERLSQMREKGIQQLPIVDKNMRVTGLVRLDDILGFASKPRKNKALIMAGGLGNRLRPLTESIPKPMLQIGERPILETIVRQLTEHGLRDIYISVNHLAESIKNYFGDGRGFGIHITYLEEETPLGTAGPLSLIEEELTSPLIMINGDVLTKIDFSSMLAYHEEHNAKITVAVREMEFEIPYGVLEIDNHVVTEISEKPVQRIPVNAGIYVIDPQVIIRTANGARADMPDLIRGTISESEKVAAFPIHEYWIDIGQLDDLSRAKAEFWNIFS